jgi:hypothetical protein
MPAPMILGGGMTEQRGQYQVGKWNSSYQLMGAI